MVCSLLPSPSFAFSSALYSPMFDPDNNPLIKKAADNEWPLIYKQFSFEDLMQREDPSDYSLRLEVEEQARREFHFYGTESWGYRFKDGSRVIVVICNPDCLGADV